MGEELWCARNWLAYQNEGQTLMWSISENHTKVNS